MAEPEAHSALQANQLAVTNIRNAINALQGIPAVHRTAIAQDYAALSVVQNLYKSQPLQVGNPAAGEHLNTAWNAVVVEVNVTYNGKRGNNQPYKVYVMLDVDIPPPGEAQDPHFGWEVHLDGARAANQHIWLRGAHAVTAGRPGPNAGGNLQEYPAGGEENVVLQGNNGSFKRVATFRRYR